MARAPVVARHDAGARPRWRQRFRRRAPASIAVRGLVAAVAVAGVVALLHLGTFPPFATVMSSSMAPAIDVGDVVVLHAPQGRVPEVGDIVRVRVSRDAQERLGYPSRVVHRVLEVDLERRTVVTQGDNLPNPDPFDVPFDAVDAYVAATIPFAGRVGGFLASPFGIIWLGIGVLVLVVMPIYDLNRERTELEELEVVALTELDRKIDQLEEAVLVPEVVAPPERDRTLEQLVLAVREYGEHLQSHTAVLRAMSAASQDLARVAARLEATAPPAAWALPAAPAGAELPPWAAELLRWLRGHAYADWSLVTVEQVAADLGVPVTEVTDALGVFAADGLVEVEVAAPALYRYRLRRTAPG